MSTKTSITPPGRAFLWLVLATVFVLSIPLIAMQFTQEVNWDTGDFILMGSLILGAGSLFLLISRNVSRKYRFATAVIIAATVFFIWAELAVGIFTSLGS